MALPTMTSGWRALAERRAGRSTVSGSIAVRGLRGLMQFILFVSIGARPMPLVTEIGGTGSPAPTACLIGSRGFAGDDAACGAVCAAACEGACAARGAAAGRADAAAAVAAAEVRTGATAGAVVAGRAAVGAFVAGRAAGAGVEAATPFAGRAGAGFNRSPTVWEG